MTERITSTQEPRTDDQVRQLVRMAEDAARNTARVVLEPPTLSKDAAQNLIESRWSQGLTSDFLAVIRKHVAAASRMFTRSVKVDRSRSPREALEATGWQLDVTDSLVTAMPRGEGEKVEMWFFELDYDPTPNELTEEYQLRGLKADPIALAQVLVDEPAFADERPVACQWGLGKDGFASYAVFQLPFDERYVRVIRSGHPRNRFCRFAGVRNK